MPKSVNVEDNDVTSPHTASTARNYNSTTTDQSEQMRVTGTRTNILQE